ncbi:hypothetical protein M758_11G028200 [Ceratodon purpureus]|nr:hypothetical protein M758_11G028200 [Ceratodon purpureus]
MSHIDYNEDNPGPGTYWLNYKHVLPQAPIQSIAHHLPIWFDYGKPGPGTYNLRKDGNDSPKYTIAEKNRWFPWSGVPGPGTYFLLDHIKHTNIRVPAYTIADKNKWFPWNGVPGPGTYNLREELPANDDMGYTIGRRFTTKGSPTPGPGAYSPQSPSGSPKYTMAQHVNDASRATTPGVGAYNLRSQEFAGPRYTMGRRFYRLRDMKRERRYSRALKHRPKPARSSSPARAGPQTCKSTSSPSAEPRLLDQSTLTHLSFNYHLVLEYASFLALIDWQCMVHGGLQLTVLYLHFEESLGIG